jgi:hypothetical protein
VLSGRCFRGYDEKEKADRLSIDGVVGDRLGAHTTDDAELPNGSSAGMRNGNAEADAGAQDGLSLLYRAEYLLESATRVIDQMMRELGYDAGLVPRGQGDDDPVWREKLSQEHR